jgi:tetratricopeptide (TPR) repeat protein
MGDTGQDNESHRIQTEGGAVVKGDVNLSDGEFVGRDKVVTNIRQLIVNPWAWLGGMIILVLGLILIAGLFNISPLQKLFPAPTPTAFAPARSDESLIVVADFEDHSGGKYQGIDPAQYIYEHLKAQTRADRLNVRVERLPAILDDNTVKSVGEDYAATLVVWGWYDALTLTPRLERIRLHTPYVSSEEEQHFSLTDPNQFELKITQDLPAHVTYLTLFILALEEYTNHHYPEAEYYVDSAIAEAGPASAHEAYRLHGNLLWLRHQAEAALDAYAQAIQLKPDYPEAYNSRGIVYGDSGDYDRARADFERAIQLRPGYVDAFNNRGLNYAHQGDYDHAIADYTQAIQIQSDYALAYRNRGAAYAKKDDFDQAIADYSAAIRLQPDDARAYNLRGIAYGEKGDYARAREDFRQAIQLRADYEAAYSNRGLTYAHEGNYAQAIADYDRAIQIQPGYALAYKTRGDAYRSLGETDRAVADYRKVLELSSDPDLRRQAEEQLKALGAQ